MRHSITMYFPWWAALLTTLLWLAGAKPAAAQPAAVPASSVKAQGASDWINRPGIGKVENTKMGRFAAGIALHLRIV